MTAITNNYNKIQYTIIYSKHRRFPIFSDSNNLLNHLATLQILNTDPKSNIYNLDKIDNIEKLIEAINTTPEEPITYNEEPFKINQKTQYFFDGAPGHILTTDDPKIAKKFTTIKQAIQTLNEKFQNIFHEGECQEIISTNNKIDYIFIPQNSQQPHIIHRFQLYNELDQNNQIQLNPQRWTFPESQQEPSASFLGLINQYPPLSS